MKRSKKKRLHRAMNQAAAAALARLDALMNAPASPYAVERVDRVTVPVTLNPDPLRQ